jgi:hypothetical protein
MQLKKRFFTIIELLVVLCFLAAGSGWVMNIIKLLNCEFDPIATEEFIRVIGLFPPVGMIVGWMTF